MFVGRERELRSLSALLDRVCDAPAAGTPGRCVFVRGRRRVGKSRLVEEFCAGSGMPYVFFTASQQGARELTQFVDELRQSTLPGRDRLEGVAAATWDAALNLLDGALPSDGPAIVVIDEFPYLVGDDPTIEGTLQKQWDRVLSRRRVLLIVIGSDLAMMEALNSYGRPLHQRGTEMVVSALSPAETGHFTGASSAAAALDAYLITGGLPLVCDDWPSGSDMWAYLEAALAEPTSPLIVSAERVLASEFPAEVLAREVLTEIGSGERTFSNIARAAGGLQAGTVTRALTTLATKRVIAKDLPLSTKKSVEARYRIADPYLRFWLRFVGPSLADIERGRSDRAVARLRAGWTAWRGRAIEPVVRDALANMRHIAGLPDADVVGSYWTRSNVPEIDLIGADRAPIAKRLAYAGSIKWLEHRPLDQADINRLVADLAGVPGATPSMPLVAVSLAGVSATGVVALGPDELLAAFER